MKKVVFLFFLEMKAPKLQVGDPKAQSILDVSLAKYTSACSIKCFDAQWKTQKYDLAKLKNLNSRLGYLV